MKYLIFGNGYLGNKFKDFLKDSIIDGANINNEEQVKSAIAKYQPEVVINCAARTGTPNIDWCEDHKLETMDSNLRGPLTLAKVCGELNQYWVQIGSGCIYEGDNNGKGFTETDQPNFKRSYYSYLKGLMNDILADYPVLQLRIRMPLDGHPGPRNLITKITKYPKIISIPNSITIIDDLMNAAKILMDKKKVGIYNIVNPEPVTHDQILKAYQEIVDPSHTYETISLEELEKITKAGRSNCVLNIDKLKSEGIIMPQTMQRVREILQEYKTYA